MFELTTDTKGKPYLRYTGVFHASKRGLWVEIGNQREKNIQYYIDVNRLLGLQVEIDEHGTYRALVLKD